MKFTQLRFTALRFSSFPRFVTTLFALAVSASDVRAWEPYPRLPLNLVYVSMNQKEAKAIFREAHRRYADIGINLSLVKSRSRKNSYDRGYRAGDDEEWEERYLSIRGGWKNYFKTRAVKRAVNVALIPRMEFGDGLKMGGMASGICDMKRGVAFAAVGVSDDRLRKAAPVVLAHEAGHLAGAWHTDDWVVSIMHPSPMMWLDLGVDLDFDLESATSIRACLRNRGYYQQFSISPRSDVSCTM